MRSLTSRINVPALLIDSFLSETDGMASEPRLGLGKKNHEGVVCGRWVPQVLTLGWKDCCVYVKSRAVYILVASLFESVSTPRPIPSLEAFLSSPSVASLSLSLSLSLTSMTHVVSFFVLGWGGEWGVGGEVSTSFSVDGGGESVVTFHLRCHRLGLT